MPKRAKRNLEEIITDSECNNEQTKIIKLETQESNNNLSGALKVIELSDDDDDSTTTIPNSLLNNNSNETSSFVLKELCNADEEFLLYKNKIRTSLLSKSAFYSPPDVSCFFSVLELVHSLTMLFSQNRQRRIMS